MKILLIADEPDPGIWDYYKPGKLAGVELILSAGDLPPEYLSFLVTMANCPLLYVHGNHDAVYDRREPEGCECIDDKLVTVNGLRILGLGGSRPDTGQPWHYSEEKMRRRVRRLGFALRRSKGVDIVLTHAPAQGCGDLPDLTHRGFACFTALIDRWKPAYFIHGHIHMRYGLNIPRTLRRGETTILNASGKYFLEI